MEADFQYDVFLSHSSQDKDVVRELARRLQADGVRVWFDEWAIQPGDNIPAKIELGLEQSRVLVLCMSAAAFGSDWAQLESQTFRFRDPLNRSRRFLPLRLDDVEIKGSLAQFREIDWRAPALMQAYAELLTACQPTVKQSPSMQLLRSSEPSETIVRSFGHTNRVWSVAFSANGRHALTGSDDRTVRLWDVASGETVRMLEGHTESILSVAFSVDGGQALTGSADRTVRLWDVASGETVRVLKGHTARVLSVAFSTDGCQVLSGSADGTVRLWDIASGETVWVLQGHTDRIYSVAWSVDGYQGLWTGQCGCGMWSAGRQCACWRVTRRES